MELLSQRLREPGPLVFRTYNFENHDTDTIHELGGWSYVWASLGGPFYVLLKGFVVRSLVMVAASLCIVVAASGALVIVLLLDLPISGMVAIVTMAALTTQGVIAVRLVRRGYLRRGWREPL